MQAGIKNYNEFLSISCLTKRSPSPTTEVADWACAWPWFQNKKQNSLDIGRYSTTLEKYVNGFGGTHLEQMITRLGNSIFF